MRIDIEKYLIIGPKSNQEAFFRRVQELGIVEFLSLKTMPQVHNPEIETLQEALHILRRRVPVKQAVPRDVREASVVAHDIVEKNEQLERAEEEKRILEKEMARIEVFGDFSVEQLRELEHDAHRKVQFFFVKQGKEQDVSSDELIFVGSKYGLDYFMSISKEPKSFPGLTEMQVDTSKSQIEAKIAELHRKIDAHSSELSLLAHQKKLLQEGLLDALNRHHLQESSERVEEHLGNTLFSAYGWVPKNKTEALKKLSEELDIYCEPIAIEEGERVPTYLENKGAGKMGEDLVNIYDTPSAQDKDPSLWVFWAFGLFFSMIIGDAGYGLILLCISAFLMYKYGKKSKLGKRVLTLCLSLSVGCILWGILTASYLGITLPINSPLKKVSLIHWMVEKKTEYVLKHHPSVYEEFVKQDPKVAQATTVDSFLTAIEKKGTDGTITYTIYDDFTDNVMMEIVIFIGTLHIMLSFLRHLRQNWAGIGWIIFMIGAYLNFPTILDATSLIYYLFGVPMVLGAKIGLYLIFIGIGLATLLALFQKKLAGLTEPMLVIQVFADVMSYLRIYALALAGVMMAQTFNSIASKAPLILGILIIFAGHTVNFILALMGGLIHGLRLNFIEWYHYSFEGGGKLFNPLTLLKHD